MTKHYDIKEGTAGGTLNPTIQEQINQKMEREYPNRNQVNFQSGHQDFIKGATFAATLYDKQLAEQLEGIAVLEKEKTDFSASLKSAYEEIKHLKAINDSMGKQLMGKDGEIENLENEVLRLKGMRERYDGPDKHGHELK